MTRELKSTSSKTGLQMSIGKTKILNPQNQHIKIGEQTTEAVNAYLPWSQERITKVQKFTKEWNELGCIQKTQDRLNQQDVPVNLKTKIDNICVLPWQLMD